jgi:hypothetical protein
MIFSSCKHYDYPLHFEIKNNSNSSIYFAFSYSYPDTNIARISNIPYSGGNQTHKIFAQNSTSEGTNVFGISQTTQMFIFDANIIENVPWDSIVAHNMVLKRYQFMESDMQKANWIITYP